MNPLCEGPKVLSAIMCVAVDVLFPLCAGVCVFLYLPLYLPDLGTQNCRNLATTRPGRRNAPGVCISLMKIHLRAPPGHPEQLGQPKDIYPSRKAVGKQREYSRAFHTAADVHVSRMRIRCLMNNLSPNSSIRQN